MKSIIPYPMLVLAFAACACDPPSEGPPDVGNWTEDDAWTVPPVRCGPLPTDECGAPGTCDVRRCAPGTTGRCVVPADPCPEWHEPVCGCDRRTYLNDCFRLREGVAREHPEACGSGASCAASPPPECPWPSEVCDLEACGVDAWGRCIVAPEACDAVVDPVCGCDGVTYGSDCERQRAGAALDHGGECAGPCAPQCRTGGGGETEWYDPCAAAPICTAACTGCRSVCDAVDTRGEGWYADCADPDTPGGCGGAVLVAYAACG